MKVYSWNILFENVDFERVETFLNTHPFDVVCLQEVPKVFIPKLAKIGFEMVSCKDFVRSHMDDVYLVVISRYKIQSHQVISFPDSWYTHTPLLGRAIGYLIGWSKPYKGKQALIAEVDVEGVLLKVMCLHLSVALVSERERYKEFNHSMSGVHSHTPLIVCGDLNILETPQVNSIKWLMGGSFVGLFDWKHERRCFESFFAKYNLCNVLKGTKTHWLTQSQLDHILVSKDLNPITHKVIKNRYGSDHNPVYCEISI